MELDYADKMTALSIFSASPTVPTGLTSWSTATGSTSSGTWSSRPGSRPFSQSAEWSRRLNKPKRKKRVYYRNRNVKERLACNQKEIGVRTAAAFYLHWNIIHASWCKERKLESTKTKRMSEKCFKQSTIKKYLTAADKEVLHCSKRFCSSWWGKRKTRQSELGTA